MALPDLIRHSFTLTSIGSTAVRFSSTAGADQVHVSHGMRLTAPEDNEGAISVGGADVSDGPILIEPGQTVPVPRTGIMDLSEFYAVASEGSGNKLYVHVQ